MSETKGAVVRYLTTEEVAARYRVSPGTIRYWRCSGYLTCGIRRGRRVLYNAADLDRWDAQAPVAGGAAA